MLVDKIIQGIRDQDLSKRMESMGGLTLQKAVKMAKQTEEVEKEQRERGLEEKQVEEIKQHKDGKGSYRRQRKRPTVLDEVQAIITEEVHIEVHTAVREAVEATSVKKGLHKIRIKVTTEQGVDDASRNMGNNSDVQRPDSNVTTVGKSVTSQLHADLKKYARKRYRFSPLEPRQKRMKRFGLKPSHAQTTTHHGKYSCQLGGTP